MRTKLYEKDYYYDDDEEIVIRDTETGKMYLYNPDTDEYTELPEEGGGGGGSDDNNNNNTGKNKNDDITDDGRSKKDNGKKPEDNPNDSKGNGNEPGEDEEDDSDDSKDPGDKKGKNQGKDQKGTKEKGDEPGEDDSDDNNDSKDPKNEQGKKPGKDPNDIVDYGPPQKGEKSNNENQKSDPEDDPGEDPGDDNNPENDNDNDELNNKNNNSNQKKSMGSKGKNKDPLSDVGDSNPMEQTSDTYDSKDKSTDDVKASRAAFMNRQRQKMHSGSTNNAVGGGAKAALKAGEVKAGSAAANKILKYKDIEVRSPGLRYALKKVLKKFKSEFEEITDPLNHTYSKRAYGYRDWEREFPTGGRTSRHPTMYKQMGKPKVSVYLDVSGSMTQYKSEILACVCQNIYSLVRSQKIKLNVYEWDSRVTDLDSAGAKARLDWYTADGSYVNGSTDGSCGWVDLYWHLQLTKPDNVIIFTDNASQVWWKGDDDEDHFIYPTAGPDKLRTIAYSYMKSHPYIASSVTLIFPEASQEDSLIEECTSGGKRKDSNLIFINDKELHNY